MGVALSKVEEQAPHLVNLYKQTGVTLDKKGLDPSRLPAAVIGTLDFSSSTESGANHLYSNGTMQEVADLAFAAGLVLDDDGEVPFSLFHNSVIELGEIDLGNCKGFVDQAIRGKRMGGTSYLSALRWIIDQAGYGHVDLGSAGGHRHGFLRHHDETGQALSVKATAPYPTLALFVTDGEPTDDRNEIEELLKLMSQLPIFVQFIGVGAWSFEFLEELDEMDGRFIDNANFFDAKKADHNQEKMLELMLGEFPDYYAKAKRQGLLV